MKKALLFLADGFEEIEAITTIDLLYRAGVNTLTVGVTGALCEGSHGITISTDIEMDSVFITNDALLFDNDVFICPGGGRGAESLKQNAAVCGIIKKGYKLGKLIAAICAAPIVLQEANIMNGKKYTIYPSMKDVPISGIYCGEDVVQDGNIITAAGPGATPAFAFAIIEYLVGKERAEKVANEALFKK